MTERLAKAVKTELENDYLKAEDDLEKVINSSNDSYDSVKRIKRDLREMNIIQSSLDTWSRIIEAFQEDNDKNTGENDGSDTSNR